MILSETTDGVKCAALAIGPGHARLSAARKPWNGNGQESAIGQRLKRKETRNDNSKIAEPAAKS